MHNCTVVIINGHYIFQLQSSHHQAVYVRSKKGNHTPVVYMMLHIPKHLHSPAIRSVQYFMQSADGDNDAEGFKTWLFLDY